jgi:hypothetical protein
LDLSTVIPTVVSEPEVEVVEDEVDLSSMTKAELVKVAKELDIDTKGLTKAKILEALS